MTKFDFAMLDTLWNKLQSVNKLTAVTQKVIHAEMNASMNTLYRRLVSLVNEGYVARGIKEANEYTYYITDEGKNALEEAMQ